MPAIQIKPIAVALFANRLPSFLPYPKKAGYWFRRKRDGITDILVCSASLKYGEIQIDLYCGIFDDWAGGYGTHLAWAGKRLDNLRYNSNAINVDLAGYRHQQTMESIVSALEQAVTDIERYALPFFEEFRTRIIHHPLTAAAFEWIREHQANIPVTMGTDIEAELVSAGFYSMTNPHFLGLRDYLRSVASKECTSREDNKDISILVMDLFRRYTETNGNI